ncbi:MAG: 50S ribosomal protein L16 [Clostridia bacterium]|nr:50S ribosomal protein L16 [Clostridia bacterium]
MLVPKRTKYRKMQKGRIRGNATRGNKLVHGDYGIAAMEPTFITNNQIESARVVISRYTKKFGKMWITIFPDKPITKKPAETRMGSGKGNPEYFVAVVKPGRVMFEISGLDEATSKEALRKAIQKLPIKCKIVSREEQAEGGKTIEE